MKILFITNVPSPYRVSFFNELGKKCDLTVCFERQEASDRNKKWINNELRNFNEIYARVKPVGSDQSKGNGIVEVIKKECFDHLIISGYASPSVMKAIIYCRLHNIAYFIESDGGFFQKDHILKKLIKKFLLCGAKAHFTTCDEHIKYLHSLGVSKNKIHKYKFTSLYKKDILNCPVDKNEKLNIRTTLGITEKKVVLSVGQFIYRKGYDILLEACKSIPNDTGIYIVGGKPTKEYSDFKDKFGLHNVHFVDFMTKPQLREWYLSADCVVLPTREDIWGLVINEAMSYGLPIITTNRCIAGLELVENSCNGYIIESENSTQLADKIKIILNNVDLQTKMSENSLKKISEYTFENMAEEHINILKKYSGGI